MASLTPKEIYLSQINGGMRFENGNVVTPEAINAPLEASAYVQKVAKEAKKLADLAMQKVNDSAAGAVTLSAYPVGSLYISVSETSPAALFGGTWERIKDRFILGSGDTYLAGSMGGEATHTLTTDEMPAHTHNVTGLPYQFYATYQGATTDARGWAGTSGSRASGSAGGGGAHNNMPPYLAVYMWKRIPD